MISVDIREKAFDGKVVLRDVRFEIAPGETVALLGASGIGKSTLLRILAGIDTQFVGQVRRPESMAMVFQEPTLLPWRTVVQNLTLVHPDLTQDAAYEALDRVGLMGKAEAFPGQLSLGQQRRLALARAIAGRPELLLLDEPFASLDPETGMRMLDLTEGLIREVKPATLFVTHAKAEADRLANRCLSLVGVPARVSDT